MLPFGKRQPEQRIHRLDDLLCPAGFKIHFPTTSADPRLESGKLDFGPLFFELLRDGLPPHLATTFGALRFRGFVHMSLVVIPYSATNLTKLRKGANASERRFQ